jgi:hypothetical protein
MRHLPLRSMLVLAVAVVGCASQGQTGALGGAGLGALLGQVIGGSTESTLIGAGVGAGLGYIIGNEMDKADAQSRDKATAAELMPFSGTSWQLVSANPQPDRKVRTMVARFDHDGNLNSTMGYEDGAVETSSEKYRVVGQTLIVNKPDYVVNARYKIEGDQLYVDTGKRSLVLARVSP